MTRRSRHELVAERAVALALEEIGPQLHEVAERAIAQAFREIVADQVRDGIARRKAAGTYTGGLGPEISDEAIARILELRAERLGIQRIAQLLEAEGIAAPRGPHWHKSTVRDALRRAGQWHGAIGPNQSRTFA